MKSGILESILNAVGTEFDVQVLSFEDGKPLEIERIIITADAKIQIEANNPIK